MPEQYGDRPHRSAPPLRPTPKSPLGNAGRRTHREAEPRSVSPVAPTPSATPHSPATPTRHREFARVIPLLIIFGAVVGALVASRDAIATGDWVAAIGPLLVIGIIAFNLWRRSRRD